MCFVFFLFHLHKTQVDVTEESCAVSLLDSEKRQRIMMQEVLVLIDRVFRFYITEITSPFTLLNAQSR